MNLHKKIIIGGAQLGMKYGVANKYGEISANHLERILHFAIKKKIYTIDTATSYNRSLKKISKIIKNKKFQKKIKLIIKVNKISSLNDMEIHKHLSSNNVSCIMAHSTELFLKKSFQKKIINLKKKFNFQVGVSIYENDELYKLKKFFDFINIIQMPYNIINFKVFDKKILKLLRKKKIKLHARSIFYQGVLLMKQQDIKKKFKKFLNKYIELNYLLKKKDLSLFFLCIKFVIDQKHFNKLIFGFDTLFQLKEIVRTINSKKRVPNKIYEYLKKNDLTTTIPDPRQFKSLRI